MAKPLFFRISATVTTVAMAANKLSSSISYLENRMLYDYINLGKFDGGLRFATSPFVDKIHRRMQNCKLPKEQFPPCLRTVKKMA